MKYSIRDACHDDIAPILEYWHGSGQQHLFANGIDPEKITSREEHERFLREDFATCSDHTIIACVDGSAVGHFALRPLVPGDWASFHAHIWHDRHRRLGVLAEFTKLAGFAYLERFDLKRMRFTIPSQNTKLVNLCRRGGLPYIGEDTLDGGICVPGTKVSVFEYNVADRIPL